MEIVVPATAFVNERERVLFTLKREIVLFTPGVDLWISLNSMDCTLSHELYQHPGLIQRGGFLFNIASWVTLTEPLSLLLQGIHGGRL